MEVLFESVRIQALFNSFDSLTRKYGSKNAKAIRRRLDNLFSARNLEDARSLIASLHELKGDREGTMTIHLEGKQRLIIAPADNPVPRKSDGGLDRVSITTVVVLGVENYYD